MFIPEEYANTLKELVETSQGIGSRNTVEIVGRHKNGALFPIELSAFARKLPNGRVSTRILRDITERERAEQALRESEARFRSLFENMTEGVVLHEVVYDESGTATDYRILTANPAFEEHTGFAVEQCRGQLASILYGTGSAPFLDVYSRTANSGEPYAFDTYFQPMERYFHISVSSPKQGHFVTVFEDITKHKRAEETLRTTMQRFHRILSNIFVSILVVDEDDGIEFVNQTFCDQFDFAEAPSDLIAMTDKEMLQKVLPTYADPEANLARIQQILSQGDRILDEEVLMRNGRVLLRDYIPILVDGMQRGRMWQHRDITERKRAEEALRESETKYRTLFENMTEEVHFWEVVRDEAGRIKTWRLVDANPPTLNSWGRTSLDEIKEKTTDEIFGPGASDHYMPVVQKIMTEGVAVLFRGLFPQSRQIFPIYQRSSRGALHHHRR